MFLKYDYCSVSISIVPEIICGQTQLVLVVKTAVIIVVIMTIRIKSVPEHTLEIICGQTQNV